MLKSRERTNLTQSIDSSLLTSNIRDKEVMGHLQSFLAARDEIRKRWLSYSSLLEMITINTGDKVEAAGILIYRSNITVSMDAYELDKDFQE